MFIKIFTFFKLSTLIFWLVATTAWSALAIYYGDSNSSLIQQYIAIAVALFGLGIVIFQFTGISWRKNAVWIHGLVFLIVVCWWFINIEPSNYRQWQADVSKLPYAIVNENLVTVNNIRHFSYRSEFEYQAGYYDKTFDLNKLEGLDLFAVYWMGPAIAHIILSFDFGEDNHLAVSIEARKEAGEGYSTIKGFFRQYELIYIVADERDLIGLRTHYRQDPPEHVYRYRPKGPKENIKRLFLEYIDNINALYESPAFYNTLLANCTSIIWLHTRVNPEHLPFSWKILLSGYVPEYLYESGRLNRKVSFDGLIRQAYINPLVEGLEITESYSRSIRSLERPEQMDTKK